MNILNAKNIHCIGIGGIGVSSIAHILHKKGAKVSGSDNMPSGITKSAERAGMKVYHNHDAKYVTKKHDLVIYSPAIPSNNPELKAARSLKIPTISYAQALGELTKQYYTVAIAGTHGKSTTTAMTARIAIKAGLDPTIVIGTKMRELKNRNFRVGESNLLIIEACEYKDTFLQTHPNILVVTNIEADHLDYFKNFTNYKNSFKRLAAKVPKDGAIVVNPDNKPSRILISSEIKAQIITWSHSKKRTDYILQRNELTQGKEKLNVKPGVIGEFNIDNATFAAITNRLLNVPNKKIEQALHTFRGTWRRLEKKRKKLGKTLFIDDYGHHPTEITATLLSIRDEHPKARILCVYQPHQHNRTKHFLNDFAKSFSDADQVIIPDIYKVRDSEEDAAKVTAESLAKAISRHHKNAFHGHGLRATAQYIKKNHRKFDIIITMGAGNIDGIYKWL